MSPRQSIPRFGMSEAGQAELRQQGIVIIPFMESVRMEPERLQPHYHEFFQIFLLQGGAQVMHDFADFHVSGTTLVFLSPGQVHTVAPGAGLRGTTISFSQAFFDDQTPPPSALFDFPFFFPVEMAPWLEVPDGDPFEILAATRMLQAEFDAAQSGAAEVLRAALRILLVRASRLYARVHPALAEVSRASQLVRAFHLAVEQHFRQHTTVTGYATLLKVSANHLNDTVSDQTGRSAGEIIRQRRLLDAKRLLLHSRLSVSEIGYELGFRDPSYFSRFFRREADQSPESFRAKIREKYQQKAF